MGGKYESDTLFDKTVKAMMWTILSLYKDLRTISLNDSSLERTLRFD